MHPCEPFNKSLAVILKEMVLKASVLQHGFTRQHIHAFILVGLLASQIELGDQCLGLVRLGHIHKFIVVDECEVMGQLETRLLLRIVALHPQVLAEQA
jgi:hypothetical protein